MVEEKTNIGRISIVKGVAKGSSFFLARDLYSIGRSESNTLFIPDEGISRNHCRIIRKVNAYYLVDSGSTNGTFLNGEKLEPNKHYDIRPNSEIRVGETIFHFDIEDTDYDFYKRPRETTSAPFAEGGFDTEGTRELPPAALDALKKKEDITLPFSIRSSRNLSTIYKIFSSLAAVADRKYVIDRSVSLITEALGADRGFLFLAENLEGREMKPTAWASRQKLNMDDVSALNIRRNVISRVLSEGDSVLSPGSLSGPGVYGAKNTSGGKSTSAMSAPIQIKDKIHGILYLDTESKDRYFKRSDVELLTAIGIQLGTVMENMELFSRYQNQFIGVIKILVNVIETKHEYAFGHSSRVTQICLAIAGELELDRRDEETLHIAALMHDIGKVAIPEEVLNKPDKLTEKEWDMIK
ncbi:MAG: FHA domain-containing protein, partial [Pseudomonadota bacterium]